MWWNNENNARRKYSNKAGRGQQRVQAVSYTHLDVYKRQECEEKDEKVNKRGKEIINEKMENISEERISFK